VRLFIAIPLPSEVAARAAALAEGSMTHFFDSWVTGTADLQIVGGQGEAGAGGGKSGDLFLRVRLARHPDFSVEGSDLIHEVRIQPMQAVLGGELLVPTLEGKVRLKIPSGTQGGQRFRLRERGRPGVSGKRGDLYVIAQINIPKKLTNRERELWSELAKLHDA